MEPQTTDAALPEKAGRAAAALLEKRGVKDNGLRTKFMAYIYKCASRGCPARTLIFGENRVEVFWYFKNMRESDLSNERMVEKTEQSMMRKVKEDKIYMTL